MEPVVEENKPTTMFNPVSYGFEFLATYGWYIVALGAVGLYVAQWLRPKIEKWREAREDAEYHKDPDKALKRMEAIQRAREKQQQDLLEASQRALEAQREREERKRAEALESLKKYGGEAAGQRLGAGDDDYLPLSGGASTSSYRPPKRSACRGGGCGR